MNAVDEVLTKNVYELDTLWGYDGIARNCPLPHIRNDTNIEEKSKVLYRAIETMIRSHLLIVTYKFDLNLSIHV